ncbi:predicted protein [Sclerotinia sclerotiorum 1980 UF-70]|uniref:Uncharacterized protein n=1 Tax=Sclerotinia sclerotiorum (strain ATCC 18683 / 1980 / Ss-1) TaxID=665079 RepID=A7EQK5_SCLS1|nr:predicted protein [Sclerotinia sclerotiorum 1980 UF-70]EDN91747.1 predicted protein [Sclerotinia sclerotiorum 1980 UF-70]
MDHSLTEATMLTSSTQSLRKSSSFSIYDVDNRDIYTMNIEKLQMAKAR